MIKEFIQKSELRDGWEPVPCPSPLHSTLSYVYTIDIDSDILTISEWISELTPMATRLNLTRALETTCLPLMDFVPVSKAVINPASAGNRSSESPSNEVLRLDIGMPTPMNELQEQFLTDFLFLWRFYIDDPLTWYFDSPVFRLISMAFLRLASWDFEVSGSDTYNDQLPIDFASVPRWSQAEENIFWFHGYLIVLCEALDSTIAKGEAVSKAQDFLGQSCPRDRARLILVSPKQIAFVELTTNGTLATDSLPWLTNTSATECSVGARALLRILTSNCWKSPQENRERWGFHLPPELLRTVMDYLNPRDAVAFAQGSLVAEECYYRSIPQFANMRVQNYRLSIPCCGKRAGLEASGVRCASCYAWYHLRCVGLMQDSSSTNFICASCTEKESNNALCPGGINLASRRLKRIGSRIMVGNSAHSLALRLAKPSHMRPELRFMGDAALSRNPSLVDYVLVFNGVFSGLAYGLEA
ncbi:uncharacterized protein DSM5745_08078 [Aspergillus mulundensis]|uniref:Zinc finger PHD-type domain-containing protein n=1 Tax=Aspergillus mulundensis TaxID=1810919 RepID=A0A3D8R943_9EURO|nr:hypothetical protein DSM5745_08078 [Aspergillus mulundensis]RDW70567.1 hypothetical protein DSM5745_08078 [Aspergillus mulundensis]